MTFHACVPSFCSFHQSFLKLKTLTEVRIVPNRAETGQACMKSNIFRPPQLPATDPKIRQLLIVLL